ncbi:MAG: PQQ-binding-like beta-propeller repeat protein [Acidobacteria bacterium]|nr:PQQ-binding-like beta-propeller repeat protein [Acidobacteriota bacterium]
MLALDARTGELRWHFQVVRHDIWDRDLPAPPTLVELEHDGTLIDAVALTTKSGHLYVFDRDTGEPLYDIIEEETLPSELPGEVPAPTEPVSAVAVTRQAFELTTRSPEATAHVQEIIRDFDLRPWAPPTLNGTLFFPGYDGGAEWGGSAFDPATDRLIVNMSEIGGILQLYEIPVGFSDGGVYAEHCGSCHGPDLEGTTNGPALDGVIDRLGRTEVETIVREGRDRMPAFAHLAEIERRGVLRHLAAPAAARAGEAPSTEVRYAHGGYRWVRDHEGLPGNTPPWGTLTSVDLATGEFDWQVPFGGYPGHEDLGYGSESYGGPVVTAGGLVFIAATPDRKLRAIDVRNGEELWQAELPAAGYSTPVT